MKNKKIKFYLKIIVAIVIFIFLILIYNNLFAGINNSRNKDFSKYKITNNEKNKVKDAIREVDEVESIDIHINNNSKIIKIIVILKSDVDFDRMNKIATSASSKFNKKNLSYYDIEFYIDSENKESSIYPKIGYKFKDNSEFSW